MTRPIRTNKICDCKCVDPGSSTITEEILMTVKPDLAGGFGRQRVIDLGSTV